MFFLYFNDNRSTLLNLYYHGCPRKSVLLEKNSHSKPLSRHRVQTPFILTPIDEQSERNLYKMHGKTKNPSVFLLLDVEWLDSLLDSIVSMINKLHDTLAHRDNRNVIAEMNESN